MSTSTISPLRQRMIEDMNARKLGAAHAEEPHSQLQAVRCISQAVARYGHARMTSAGSSCTCRDRHEHLQSQPHHDRAAVLVPRDAAAAGSRRRDLSHPGAAEDSAGDEPGRDPAPAGGRRQPQGSRAAQSRLWLRIARRRGGPAQGQAYRQRAEHHSHRAVQGPQGSQCHAVAGDARSVAAMVEGAPGRYDATTPVAGTLAVSRPQARQADDHPPAQPPVPRGGQCGRDQEGRDAACAAPQLRNPPARARYRYS